jgi:hypothetical protein
MERTSLKAFFFFMPFCAALVLSAIWTETSGWPTWLAKLMPTAFIFGFASFLTWFTLILRRMAER